MSALIAEDLLLLVLDRRGSTRSVIDVRLVLAAGVLTELALAGHVALEGKRGPGLPPRVQRVPGGQPPDPVLRDAIDVVARRPTSASSLIRVALGDGLLERLAERLAAAGVLERRDHRLLGIVRWTWWPPLSTARADVLRADLRRALVDGAEPDARTAALVGILAGVEQVPTVLGLRGAEGRAAALRAKGIAVGDWVADAVWNASRAP